jgi:23S rRNA (adenine2503-C2)-methyltransferase
VPAAFEMTREDLAELLSDEPRYRTDQVWRGLWERGVRPGDMTDLPKALRDRLEAALVPALHEVSRSVSSDGQTTKWLWALADGRRIETVLMLYPDRATVCVSSQAGCAMGCTFCATGQGGFDRQLSVGEIVEQVVNARRDALPRRLGNVVFMGMGEPLSNYEHVWSAVEHIHSDLGISARHITLSTVGVVPASAAWPRKASRSTWPSPFTPLATSCGTRSCRSTGATPCPCSWVPALSTWPPKDGAFRSNGH